MDIRLIVKAAFLSAVFIWGTGCAGTYDESPLRIRTGTDDMGTTYAIVDSATDSLIYYCGNNEMLDRYPGKVRELKQYLNSFSSDFKKEIKESLMRCADFE